MISIINGTCTQIWPDGQMIIFTSGIGYGIRVVKDLIKNQEYTLYIYEHIREDAYDLYGFPSQEELLVFRQILTVSGAGPKIALAILRQGSITQFQQALNQSNLNYFQSVSGVGKKLAQKIILELRNKLGQESDLNQLLADDRYQDITSALANLGYKPQEYQGLLKELPTDLIDPQAQISWALKQLRRKK